MVVEMKSADLLADTVFDFETSYNTGFWGANGDGKKERFSGLLQAELLVCSRST